MWGFPALVLYHTCLNEMLSCLCHGSKERERFWKLQMKSYLLLFSYLRDISLLTSISVFHQTPVKVECQSVEHLGMCLSRVQSLRWAIPFTRWVLVGWRHWCDDVGLKAMGHNHHLRIFFFLFDGAVAAPGSEFITAFLTHGECLRQNSQKVLRQNLVPKGS